VEIHGAVPLPDCGDLSPASGKGKRRASPDDNQDRSGGAFPEELEREKKQMTRLQADRAVAGGGSRGPAVAIQEAQGPADNPIRVLGVICPYLRSSSFFA
jgi:hypothetical protein